MSETSNLLLEQVLPFVIVLRGFRWWVDSTRKWKLRISCVREMIGTRLTHGIDY